MDGVTLKRLAQELNISVSTVSRALNGKNVVKEETKQLVIEAAKKYSYMPNEVARSLQKNSTNTVAVVLPDISETFFGTIVNEIDRMVTPQGYMIILTDTHEDIEKERKYLNMLLARRVDALILATVDSNGDAVSRYMENHIPVIFIDNIPGVHEIDAVIIDNKKASKIAVEHLISYGHKKIAMITGVEKETTGAERLAGFIEALNENDIPIDERLIMYGDYKQESAYHLMRQLLQTYNENPFTAVYAVSERMTYGVIQAIEEQGLRIPEDISVVGFDIHKTGMEPRMKITSVRQPEIEIGRKVGEVLLDRLNNSAGDDENVKHDRLLLEPFLEDGETVCRI